MSIEPGADDIHYRIYHLFLPPKLPQKDDRSPKRDRNLISNFLACAQEFLSALQDVEDVEPVAVHSWIRIVRMLKNAGRVNQGEGASMDAQLLATIVNSMSPGDSLPIHVGAQNAAVILRKDDVGLTYESFFASLPTAKVMQTVGKVVARFPAHPRLPLPANPDLARVLCSYVAEMHTLEFPDAIAQTKKAGNKQAEYRESAYPHYVTEFLSTVVRSFSGDQPDERLPHTDYVTKRLGDHVLWSSAKLPWRRSPLLLVLKVAMQTALVDVPAQYGYKAFMTFLLCRTLREAAMAGTVVDDLLYVMNAKVAQRIYKLRHTVSADVFPIDYVCNQSRNIAQLLEGRWQELQRAEAQPKRLAPPSGQEVREGKTFSLECNRAYIQEVISRDEGLQRSCSIFNASSFEAALPRSWRANGSSPPETFDASASLESVLEAIHDVSTWLNSSRFSQWMHSSSPKTRGDVVKGLLDCGLASLSRFGVSGGDANPELFSTAFLNVLDLWVVLDQAATEAIPLLAQYRPDITIESFEALLLRDRSSMERLSRIEQYLSTRMSCASYGSPFHLNPWTNCVNSFAARFARDNVELCRLRADIEDAARSKRQQKRAELASLEEQRLSLLAQAEGMACQYTVTIDYWGEECRQHSGGCKKCSLEKQAKNLHITVFEEPLPADTHLADALVFELKVPKMFSIWRSATFNLIKAFASDLVVEKREAHHALDKYTDMQRSMFGRAAGQVDHHITLASDHKSFLIAHYNTCTLPCSEDSVLKNHGPRWWPYERSVGRYLPSPMPAMDLRSHCTPSPLTGAYQSLNWTLSRTTHTPNMVIARQSECDNQLSLHEWAAFGQLRAGLRLQWHNVVLAIETEALKLAEPAVHTLIRQAMLQAEKATPTHAYAREAHVAPSCGEFARQALDVLRRHCSACAENWEGAWAASTLSLVGNRVYELLPEVATGAASVRSQLRTFLRTDLRRVCMNWIREISVVLREAGPDTSSDTRNALCHRLIQVCVAARDTYFIQDAVFDNADAVSDYLECALVLHQQVPPRLSQLPSSLRALVQNDLLSSRALLRALKAAIENDNTGIDDAIRKTWPGFARLTNTTWHPVAGTPWVTCRTSTNQGMQSRVVHVNLLDGSIYVDGASFQALPQSILQHSLYQEVFPARYQMQILPSTMAGMTYQSQYTIEGHEVHFLAVGSDLVIRVRDQDDAVSEFVPRSKLEGDIPNIILVDCIALYRTDTNQLDFTPRSKVGWNPRASAPWTLYDVATSPQLVSDTVQTRQGLCPHSALVARLGDALVSLESSSLNIVVTTTVIEGQDQRVIVHLPRYKLEFYFDEKGCLASQEFPGCTVSTSRDIGALYGVEKLVLEDRKRSSKRLLLPTGSITVESQPCHPRITIHPIADPAAHIRTHVYDVDLSVGQIKPDGGLDSWLMLVYLHALSSSHQRDPLTDERGVDRAMRMLQSASSFAFTALSPTEMNLLAQIAALTPVRHFYPKHLKVMETTNWHASVSPLTQSDLFAPLVAEIVSFAEQRSVFDGASDGPKGTPQMYSGAEHLRQRAHERNARLSPYVSDMEQYADTSAHSADTVYHPDNKAEKSRLLQVQSIAFRSRTWDADVDTTTQLWQHFTKWSSFSTTPSDFPLSRPCLLSAFSSAKIWFTLYARCTSARDPPCRFSLAFTLAFVMYGKGLADDLIHSALSLAVHQPDERSDLVTAKSSLPLCPITLSDGWEVSAASAKKLESIIDQQAIPFSQSSEHRITKLVGEGSKAHKKRCKRAYDEHLTQQTKAIVRELNGQWPCSKPDWSRLPAANYPLVKFSKLLSRANALFESMDRNRRLHRHASIVQAVLDRIRCKRALALLHIPALLPVSRPRPAYDPPNLLSLMATRNTPPEATMKVRVPTIDKFAGQSSSPLVPCHSLTVSTLLSRLAPEDGFGAQYKRDLSACADAMARLPSSSTTALPYSVQEVETLPHENMVDALKAMNPFESALYEIGNWPSLGVRSLLAYLALPLRHKLASLSWKTALILFAKTLVQRQRERRLDVLQGADLDREMATIMGQGYDADENPDWLLVQLDSNVTIRAVQAEIARCMMSVQNRVMQLNMGEGKSSIIIPITAAACANGEDLACVVVLKPLCSQMFHLLGQRVCGLANRRLYYLPFSRDTPIAADNIRTIGRMFEDCAQSGGVLLCQPEHLLSFQLMGSSMLCTHGDHTDTQSLLRIQQWLTDRSRFILDESDEILSHKYQLIYTMGSPGPLEGHPERWLLLQQVLGLVNTNAVEVLRTHPADIQVEAGHDSVQHFRRIRILTDTAYNELAALCVDEIVHRNAIALLPFRSYPARRIDSVREFISVLDVDFEAAQDLEAYCGDSYPHLLLLRGLFAHGILKLAFKEKRWRVDYGLDLSRSRLAVPYRAKDSPALRAEFGHPDVILTLTSLSYYYGGLSDDELDTSFDRLLKTDNPALRYNDWIRDLDLPPSLQTLKGINLKDANQRCSVVYPSLRRVKSVVDFYLSECVFPKEARQFEHKLTTNPWDLARRKGRPTSGFSGTNDNKYLLPTSIVQEDIPSQLHTNALVLDHVLRPENRTVLCKDCDAVGIIAEVVTCTPAVSVILDVGAQVLELENEDMARRWLEKDARPSIEAAIYFGVDDELYVRTRDGRVEELRRSFYRDQLGKTLVYLDEAHTRGTDLKLPEGTRALVTLGPKLTKDKLMQGCMRMRKLGRSDGHSVLFLASSEIQGRIRDCIREEKAQLDSSDVLIWTMHETIRQTTESGALWANQGLNFDARQSGWEAFEAGGRVNHAALARVLREPEAHPLKELYGPRDVTPSSADMGQQTARQREIYRRCEEFGFAVSRSSRLLEEQERELAHEKETEREVQRAPPAKPKPHAVDPALKSLVKTGNSTFLRFSTLHDCLAVTSIYNAIRNTSTRFFQKGRHILATKDFVETIVLSSAAHNQKDGFMRPVQWIISTRNFPDVLLLVSPFEANEIISNIRQSPDVRLHLYAPRVSRNTRAFDDLTFLITPSSAATSCLPPTNATIHELNLFAGNLFLWNEAAYREVCQLLGLHLGEIPDALKGKVGVDGFVSQPADRAALGVVACLFQKSPSAVLRALMDLRRKGQGFLLTHIGQMLYGNEIGSDEF
ncbi:hypothetical protein GGF50DRAFT_99825 [Schizophyllum commune]